MNVHLWVRQSHRWLSIVFTSYGDCQLRGEGAAVGRAAAVVDLFTTATAVADVVDRPVPVRAAVCKQVARWAARVTVRCSRRFDPGRTILTAHNFTTESTCGVESRRRHAKRAPCRLRPERLLLVREAPDCIFCCCCASARSSAQSAPRARPQYAEPSVDSVAVLATSRNLLASPTTFRHSCRVRLPDAVPFRRSRRRGH